MRPRKRRWRFTHFHIAYVTTACGQAGSSVYSSTVEKCHIRACKKGRGSCRKDEWANARAASRQCVIDTYYNESFPYTPYEEFRLGPSNDIDWPNVVAFGDCNICKVYSNGTTNTSYERLHIATWYASSKQVWQYKILQTWKDFPDVNQNAVKST
eukprot:scaffold3600_cov171-Amphora_coffeaeformis.AAC.17